MYTHKFYRFDGKKWNFVKYLAISNINNVAHCSKYEKIIPIYQKEP